VTKPNPDEAAAVIRSRLEGRTGRTFWRSLDDLAGDAAFTAHVEERFPSLAPLIAGIDRRGLLKAMAASFALAGLTGCSGEADETAMPYVRSPERGASGDPVRYATAVTMAGYAQPAIGKTVAGRPVKLEGNPDHPGTRGASDVFLQAAILGLYDPDRSQTPRHRGDPTTWQAFDAAWADRRAGFDETKGEGLRLLTGRVTSPTLIRQVAAMSARWPLSRWHAFEPVADEASVAAAQTVFGRPLSAHSMLEDADVIVSLDADLLGPGPAQSILARRWADRREAFQKGGGESRLFAAELTPSITGAVAEDRLAVSPPRIEPLLRALAAAIGVAGIDAPSLSGGERGWVGRAAAAIAKAPGRSLVAVGSHHPAQLHVLQLLISEKTASLGATLRFTDPVAAMPPDGARSAPALIADMAAGKVKALVMLETNPAYAMPAGMGFTAAVEKVELLVHAGTHDDETAARSHWHLPLAHELESWTDARSADGSASIVQPLIRPLYATRSRHALLETLMGSSLSDRDAVQATWRAVLPGGFDDAWRRALVRGFVEGDQPQAVTPAVADRTVPAAAGTPSAELMLVTRPDPTVWDGRFAGNAWLQETPKPLSKIVWGNVIHVSPQLAGARGWANGDELALELEGGTLRGAAWITPGQAADTIAMTLGYGHARSGHLADGLGYHAASILPAEDLPWLPVKALAATGNRLDVATTQQHQQLAGFDFVRTVARGERMAEPEKPEEAPSFYPARQWDSPSWGMAIDLDLCIGCNACVVACVAENNVPMVGKDLVAQGREMHWLRVDHYLEGDPSGPRSYFQPVPCMHCEQAPCEMGCPVNAAVHSADGLNLQVYNRCIGTRTCSSYCPYKVRRFNWFDYTAADPEPIRAMRNPDVTVRSRGVMEKCTYCVQRIREAGIAAQKEGRAVRDGEVRPACQQACPSRAITFGDVTDPASAVSRKKAGARNYTLLEEANTRPRTTYLARIEDPPAADKDGGA
jgi:molybdopterin-containing oxidoreductase family iron-sulfur binding subunit